MVVRFDGLSCIDPSIRSDSIEYVDDGLKCMHPSSSVSSIDVILDS